MSQLDNMLAWRKEQMELAKKNGDAFFFVFPESWYENPHWGCENGHVSTRYLKSEVDGPVCLACHKPVYLIPSIEESEFSKICQGML